MNDLMRRSSLDPLFEDMFKGFFVRPMSFESDMATSIKLDVKEDDKGYMVHAELPGVKKEDIHVQIEGSRVAISAEVKRQNEVKDGEKVLRSERFYGNVSRSFQLAADIDEQAASAEFKDGVLQLLLPKKEKSASHKLTVK